MKQEPNEQQELHVGKESDIPIPKMQTEQPQRPMPPLSGDGPAPRSRGRSRARKPTPDVEAAPAEPAPQPMPVVTPEQRAAIAQALAAGAKMFFDTMAEGKGEHWRKPQEQLDTLGMLWAIGLEPWYAYGAKYAPLAAAALTTAGMIMPCVQRDRELAKAKEQKPIQEIAVI